jgi:hypothetical protein
MSFAFVVGTWPHEEWDVSLAIEKAETAATVLDEEKRLVGTLLHGSGRLPLAERLA